MSGCVVMVPEVPPQLTSREFTFPGIDNMWYTVVYIPGLAFTVRRSSSGTVAAWPVFPKKHAIICFSYISHPLHLCGDCSSGKIEKGRLALCFGVKLIYPALIPFFCCCLLYFE